MNTRKYSIAQEKEVASEFGGRRIANSGATLFQKGDVILKEARILIECKTKVKPSERFTIDKKWLIKNKEEAFGMGMNPNRSTLCFNFGDGDNYFIISSEFFNEVLNLLKKESL